MEIQNFQKLQLKDGIRVALNDLAEIHYKYGSTFDALQFWSRSHNSCVAKEDYFKCSKKITVSAFESLNSSYLAKFAVNTMSLDDGKSIASTKMISILDAFGRMM